MNHFLSILIRSIICVLSLIPIVILRYIAHLVSWYLWVSNSKSRQVAEVNLKLCFPDKSDDERKQIARARMWHLSMTALEMGAVWSWPLHKLEAKMQEAGGNDVLNEQIAKGKGVIILAPHHGNWEALGPWVGARHKLVCLYRPPETTALDEIVLASRSRFSAELAPTNVKGVKTLLKALKRGDVVSILPDQVPPSGSGEFVPFFGVPALTMTLVHSLIQRTGAAVVISYARRTNEAKHFQPLFRKPPEAIYSSDQLESLNALNQCVEQVVNECPEQYQWEYKRFKKSPDGQKRYK